MFEGHVSGEDYVVGQAQPPDFFEHGVEVPAGLPHDNQLVGQACAPDLTESLYQSAQILAWLDGAHVQEERPAQAILHGHRLEGGPVGYGPEAGGYPAHYHMHFACRHVQVSEDVMTCTVGHGDDCISTAGYPRYERAVQHQLFQIVIARGDKHRHVIDGNHVRAVADKWGEVVGEVAYIGRHGLQCHRQGRLHPYGTHGEEVPVIHLFCAELLPCQADVAVGEQHVAVLRRYLHHAAHHVLGVVAYTRLAAL